MKISIRGIVKNTSTWVDISWTGVDLSEASEEDVEDAVNQIRDLIAACFKGGGDGQITVENTVINIQSFAVISVRAVK